MVDPLPDRLRRSFLEILGPTGLLTDPTVIDGYTVDWTGRFRGSSRAVLRPGSTEEVAATIELCRREGLALVPQGGNTGLVGGSVPHEGELVLSSRRLTALGAIDRRDAQVTVGAGVTLAAVQQAAAALDLDVPVDLAARDSATIGGMVATNAGGTQVVRWGTMRHHLVGHEAVVGTGQVVSHLSGLVKDNTGYDLGGLLCGSEGTLGVFTSVRIALVPRPPFRVTALCGFADVESMLDAAATWRRAIPELDALEAFTGAGLALVVARAGRADPFRDRHRWYLLVEVSGRQDPTDHLGDVVDATPGIAEVVVATEPGARARLWSLREDLSLAINALGPPLKLDVSVPAGAAAQFLGTVGDVVAAVVPGARTWLFGHIGDGNVHVNVTGADPDGEAVADAVLRLVARDGGSISAEHGIGVAKKRWLHLSRSAAEIDVFRSVKRTLDPDGILNPHVLL
jgi:FAD/FMN-containing dehydrogenase